MNQDIIDRSKSELKAIKIYFENMTFHRNEIVQNNFKVDLHKKIINQGENYIKVINF